MSNRQLVYIKDDEIIKMVTETLEKQLAPFGDGIIKQLNENNKLNIKELREFFIEEINKQREFYSKQLNEYFESTQKQIDEMYERLEKIILDSSTETNNRLDKLINDTKEINETVKSNNYKNHIGLIDKFKNATMVTRGRRGKKLQGQLNK